MNNFKNFGSKQPGNRQMRSKMPVGQQQPGGQFTAEFAQESDVAQVAKRAKQSAQNKIQDNFMTPNEKFNSEFASETQGTLSQKAQQSVKSKVQDFDSK
ncbi:gamma-type small acid-soluble spore protein [Paenibacillus sp. P96]|uniref:Small, acid-soluble spore protein gamma-type n=1 Tax=Paenibacillus zeirhizosphaerae TaxID=2987519 RepID=A0ABT9FLA3_9BACL|nr:gamma-type small acid-soluble spore protein [Paenibacillus sp. P96]MDP4095523.1 gamma-type small acid-soluble spore protein [Paenibacillus sp. P96]